MKKRTLFTSSTYSILQATGGLLVHPYQTMQMLIEEKVFMWLAFLPTILGALFFVVWWMLLQSIFLSFPFIGTWAFVLIWGGCFFIFWQILLLYLFFRFLLTLR